jgi:hypothetical protein
MGRFWPRQSSNWQIADSFLVSCSIHQGKPNSVGAAVVLLLANPRVGCGECTQKPNSVGTAVVLLLLLLSASALSCTTVWV